MGCLRLHSGHPVSPSLRHGFLRALRTHWHWRQVWYLRSRQQEKQDIWGTWGGGSGPLLCVVYEGF